MPRVHKVQSARKARPEHGIEVGDTYYWWKFRKFGKRYSKTYPKRQQLTMSVFYPSVYDIEDILDEISVDDERDDITGSIESAMDETENLRDEQMEKRDNMPEQLQDSPSGEMLQERYDELDRWWSDLDDIKSRFESLDSEDDDFADEKEALVDELGSLRYEGP